MRVRQPSSDERGAVAVLVALLLVVIFGMVVLVVDVGGLLVLRGRLVTAADSASLAAAQSCATNDFPSAQAQADDVGTENLVEVPGAAMDVFESSCDGSDSGTVRVEFSGNQELYFAPVLPGVGSDPVSVSAEAMAMWGPATGAKPLPIVLNDQCMEVECGYWYDPNRSSGAARTFGFVHLGRWCISGGGRRSECRGSLSEWIEGESVPVRLMSSPQYARAVSGGDGSWETAIINLSQRDDQPRPFIVHDPALATEDDYAVVGFRPLVVNDLFLGTAASRQECGSLLDPIFPLILEDLVPGRLVPLVAEVTLCALLTGLDTVEVVVVGAEEGLDYVLEPADPNINPAAIRWLRGEVEEAVVRFFGSSEGFGGQCDLPVPDVAEPWCLVVSWDGPRVGGSEPSEVGGEDIDFGLRAIRLTQDQ